MLLKMIVSYDGTDFSGFQRQPGQRTVQGVLEESFQGLLGSGAIVGGSRTDSGVHARGQVVTWSGPVPVPLDRVAAVLNRRLPRDIRVGGAEWVADSFHPVRAARAKYYSYTVARGPEPLWPGLARYAYTVRQPLSWTHLNRAAQLLLGAHDFWAFRAEGSTAKTTERRILVSRWSMLEQGAVWRYDVGATGFLYHMVRIAVAAMLLAAETQNLDPVRRALENPREKKVGVLAPARGLTLEHIEYDRP